MFPINWPPMETCSGLRTCSIPRNSKYQSCAKQDLALTVILDSTDRLAVQKNAGAVTRDGGSGLVCRRHGPPVTDSPGHPRQGIILGQPAAGEDCHGSVKGADAVSLLDHRGASCWSSSTKPEGMETSSRGQGVEASHDMLVLTAPSYPWRHQQATGAD